MLNQTPPQFSWLSPLGIATALFIGVGLVYIIISSTGIFLLHRYGSVGPQGNGQFFLGSRADAVWFGKPAAEVVSENPKVGRLVLIFMDIITGFMFGFGILIVGIAWFGLRAGHTWALRVMVIVNVTMLATYWLLVILPFMREFGFGYSEIFHPYAAFPTVVVPIATVLAVIGLSGK